MISGILAVAAASVFAGAATYINVAEHPARMSIPIAAALAQWKPAYDRGYVMQATLAIIGFGLGGLAWWQSREPLFLAGAGAMIANWPFTLFVIMPVNRRLKSIDPIAAPDEARRLLDLWNRLHGVRTLLGAVAVVCFIAGLH